VISSDDLPWRVEALCTAARPAVLREVVDGWAMGRTGGRMRQANCVNPTRGPRGDAVKAIERGEAFYDACGQTPLFRVPAIADEMDAPLDRLRYGAEGHTATLFNSFELDPVVESGTLLEPAPGEAWLAARQRIAGEADPDHAAFCAMVRAVALPTMFASTHVDGVVAAIAYGALGDGLLVLEAVATDPAFRGRGLARKTLHNLIAWSKAGGARAACLQVQLDNAPALALYASLGFGCELYRYHYRRRRA